MKPANFTREHHKKYLEHADLIPRLAKTEYGQQLGLMNGVGNGRKNDKTTVWALIGTFEKEEGVTLCLSANTSALKKPERPAS